MSIISFFFALPYADYFFADSRFASIVGFTNVFLLISIPLLGLVLFIGRLFFRRQTSPHLRAGLWSLWVVNLISILAIGSITGREFNQGADIEKTLGMFKGVDTLRIDMKNNPYQNAILTFGPLQVTEDRLINRNINLHIEKSKGDHIELVQRNYSRGNTIEEADRLAKEIAYVPEFKENSLVLDPFFAISNGEKWRVQQVDLTLKVPEGKSVHFENNINYYVRHIELDPDKGHPWVYRNQTWKMEENGLVCHAYRQKHNYDRELDYEDFNHLIIDGGMEVLVEQADQFDVELEGKERYARNVEFAQMGKTLTISTNNNYNYKKVKLHIRMPKLEKLDVENTGRFRVQGFEQKSMAIKYRGRRGMKVLVDVDTLLVKQSERSTLDLRGKGKLLQVNLDERADFDAEHFEVDNAEITAKGYSRALLDVTTQLTQDVESGSKVEMHGNADVTDARAEEDQQHQKGS
ncbi:MAG: DUF2807 domain-containing protein [Bacteroidota bacterium]